MAQRLRSFKSALYLFLYRDWLLTKLTYIGRYKRFGQWLSKYFELLAGILGIVLAIAFSALMLHYFGIDAISNDAMANLFIGAGAMSGSVLAIIFSLSLFALQNSADLYSSRFFEVYTHGIKERLIYVGIVFITVAFFAFAILWSGNDQASLRVLKIGSICAILVVMMLLFILVAVQFKRVREKINPLHTLAFLEKQATSFLKDTNVEIMRFTEFASLMSKEKNEDLVRLSISNEILLRKWADLNRQVENILEISMKLSARHELGAVDSGMMAVGNILIKFMGLKKNYSVALPSALAPLALEHDTQNFTGSIMDRLNKAGDDFMKNQLTQNAVKILHVYKAISNAAKDTKFLNTSCQNPVFSQVIGYLCMYVDSAIRHGDVEVVYQSIFILDELGQSIAKEMETTPYHQIEQKLVNIAAYGIQAQKSFIINQCNDSLLNILTRVVQHEMRDLEIKGILEKIQSIIVGSHVAKLAGLLGDDFNIDYGVNITFGRLTNIIGLMFQIHQKKTNDEKINYEGNIIEAFEEIYRVLRSMTEQIKNCDNVIAQAVSILIFNWNRMIIDVLNKGNFSDSDALKNRMSWNIHLPGWFIHNALQARHSIYFEEIIETPAKTGLILLHQDIQDDLADKCIDAAFSIAKDFLEKSGKGYGYDEPRIMLCVCYLGVLAFKKNKLTLFNKIVGMIRTFEEMYRKKYPPPTPDQLPKGIKVEDIKGLPSNDQLHEEVIKWESDFVREKLNRLPIKQDSDDMILSMVNIGDIHRFIYEVWGTIFANSPIKDELVETQKKKLQES
ncbi:MAG: hypothetical protein Q7T03_09435 [Deltaproteobacteria bacterium]|nr:hypothetical protein [Deltaproteobacteria bacterium]